MKRAIVGLLMAGALAACNDNILFVDDPGVIGGEVPAAPRAVAVTYYAGSVQVTWELAPNYLVDSLLTADLLTEDTEAGT